MERLEELPPPVACPNCRKPTLILVASRPSATKQITCHHCASPLLDETDLHFCPEFGQGEWKDAGSRSFARLRSFLEACFQPNRFPDRRSVGTQRIDLLQPLVKRISLLGKPGLAPWIMLLGKDETFNRINDRNRLIFAFQEALADLRAKSQPEFHLVNWELLAPLSDDIFEPLRILQERLAGTQKPMDWDRVRHLLAARPYAVYAGKDAFLGYVAFLFPDCTHAILENPIIGNAIYYFPKAEWESLSRQSKADLKTLDANAYGRLEHRGDSWKYYLKVRFPETFREAP